MPNSGTAVMLRTKAKRFTASASSVHFINFALRAVPNCTVPARGVTSDFIVRMTATAMTAQKGMNTAVLQKSPRLSPRYGLMTNIRKKHPRRKSHNPWLWVAWNTLRSASLRLIFCVIFHLPEMLYLSITMKRTMKFKALSM
jgi:hypothetical protein